MTSETDITLQTVYSKINELIEAFNASHESIYGRICDLEGRLQDMKQQITEMDSSIKNISIWTLQIEKDRIVTGSNDYNEGENIPIYDMNTGRTKAEPKPKQPT